MVAGKSGSSKSDTGIVGIKIVKNPSLKESKVPKTKGNKASNFSPGNVSRSNRSGLQFPVGRSVFLTINVVEFADAGFTVS